MSSVCDNNEERGNTDNGLFGMEYIGFSKVDFYYYNRTGFYLYRNTITDILYILYDSKEKCQLTEMHDPETGLPLTYKRYLEMVEKQN